MLVKAATESRGNSPVDPGHHCLNKYSFLIDRRHAIMVHCLDLFHISTRTLCDFVTSDLLIWVTKFVVKVIFETIGHRSSIVDKICNFVVIHHSVCRWPTTIVISYATYRLNAVDCMATSNDMWLYLRYLWSFAIWWLQSLAYSHIMLIDFNYVQMKNCGGQGWQNFWFRYIFL